MCSTGNLVVLMQVNVLQPAPQPPKLAAAQERRQRAEDQKAVKATAEVERKARRSQKRALQREAEQKKVSARKACMETQVSTSIRVSPSMSWYQSILPRAGEGRGRPTPVHVGL